LWLWVLAALLAAGCSDPIRPTPGEHASPAPFIAASGFRMQTAEFVWISLPPESVPTVDQAVLRVVRTGSRAVAPVVDGGFDPVALAAHEGDSIVVTIVVNGVEKPTGFSFVIPPPSRPVIVRTSPPKGKRDVPLNARVTVVFSEPIDASSLTTVSVQVRSGGTAVEGQLHFIDNTRLVAEFVPAQPLAGSTDYELRIAETIRDLDGMTLGAVVSVPFTTASGVASDSEAVASVRVTPTAGTLEQGLFLVLAAEVTGTEGSLLARPVTWASGDSTVATVSPSGGVFGVRAGSTTITATSEGIAGTATVTVTSYTGGAGPKIAFVRDGQIHLVNPDGSGLVRLTDGPNDADPAWSPDGRRIAFSRQRAQPPGTSVRDIFIMNADGSNVVQRTNDYWSELPAWSPDGSRIAFSTNRYYDYFLVHVMSAADDGAPPRLVSFTSGWSTQPAWSPDGTRIAFVSDWRYYDITYDVFLANPDAPGIVQKTNGFAFDGIVEEEGNRITLMQFWQPAWSPDGRTMAVVACPLTMGAYCESSAGLWLIDASKASLVSNRSDVLAMLTPTSGFAGPTWSPDGGLIAYASGGSLYWIRKDGTAQGLITANGHSPSWRR
jgi:Tol biopolymer transport system component